MASTPTRVFPKGSPTPPHGSIVLVHGLTGTAYQRHFNDGLFHPTTDAEPVDFQGLFQITPNRPVYLVYVPDPD